MTNLHTFVVLAYEESPFLESCIKSVVNQKSNVVIATTTPNPFIKSLAKKYSLEIFSTKHTNLGGDFDFAFSVAKTPLVTIAHQDDIYEKNYAENVIKNYKKHPDSSIIFTDYYELRNQKRINTNKNLKIKRLLLLPFYLKNSFKNRFMKRSSLRFGCTICCPSVTFVKANCPQKIFTSNFKSNVDWDAWEKLSRKKSAFTFIPKKLMGHRISEATETTKIINAGIRTKEDYEILRRFWPNKIAKIIAKFYQNSENSNQLKTS